MTPARLIDHVEDVNVYMGTSLGSFSVVGSSGIAAMNRDITDLPDQPKGQVPNKYDVREVIKQSQSSMDPQIRAQFAQLFRTFSDVFSKSELAFGKFDLVQHKTDLYPGSKPVKLPNRRMPMHFKKDLRRKIEKILENKLRTPCHSPYCSPDMLIPKKNGKLRLVINYRQLNKQTDKCCRALPPLEELLTLWREQLFLNYQNVLGFLPAPFRNE